MQICATKGLRVGDMTQTSIERLEKKGYILVTISPSLFLMGTTHRQAWKWISSLVFASFKSLPPLLIQK